MDEHNPYAGATTRIAEASAAEPGELASRWARLGAAILDGLLLLVIMLPIQWFSGFLPALFNASRSGYALPTTTMLMWSIINFVVFVAMQAWPLHQSGQTWGKRALAIRIVDLAGHQPPLLRLLALRYLPMQLIGMIPFVGGLVTGLVDPLFIFRQDRRCLHDLIAGTRVVNAR